MVAFAAPLWELFSFAWGSALYSHILLIPFVSVWLAWRRLDTLEAPGERRLPWLSLLPALCAMGLLIGLARADASRWSIADRLATTTSAFVLLTLAAAMGLLGWRSLRALRFPLTLLVFLIPFPDRLTGALEAFLQHGSAAAAHVLFTISGTPFLFDDLTFELPGIALRVAPECSGIHSTLVLFITSVLAAYLFLRSGRKRALLVAFVVPLAVVRNGLRIFVIGQLCVQIGPEMIESAIHRRGGPLFFAISLIPLSAFLYLLVRLERQKTATPQTKEQHTSAVPSRD